MVEPKTVKTGTAGVDPGPVRTRGLGRLVLAAFCALSVVATVGAAAHAGGTRVDRAAAERRVELPVGWGHLHPADAYVTACGASLCLRGRPYALRMASGYGMEGHRAQTVALAQQAGLTTLRLVDMLDETGPVSGAYDETRWRAVDADIAAARAAGLHVELDLSSYRNLLVHAGVNPYAADWGPFLTFVAHRVNTVTGVRYADDPTIALVAFAGELEPPTYGGNTVHATAAQITGFFSRTFAQWRALDPHHLRTTGGLLFVQDPYAGIDWRTLMSLPGDDVPAIHVYSQSDVTQAMPDAAAWSAGRPWIVEEYGATQGVGDAARAQFFAQVSSRATSLGAAGVGFWNLGPEQTPGSHDVNPAGPLTWAAAGAED